jgi:hypothetical protein
MKRYIAAVMFVALSGFVFAQPSSAGPVTFVVGKTTHIVHKAVYRIDRHVVRPSRRAIARHTPP